MGVRWRKLQDLAMRQHGYFTTRQAEDAGLTRPALHYQFKQGFVTRPQRGIYRFAAYPPTELEREAVLMLWSRLESAVAFSHETALRHFNLSDVFPSKYHLTVPPGFRMRPPTDVILHKSVLTEGHVHQEDVLRFTTPARTILDLVRDDYPMEQIQLAYEQGVERGLIRRRELSPNSQLVQTYLEQALDLDRSKGNRSERYTKFLHRLAWLTEGS
jgi:predicted transcriptional regulator of viral defense system